MQLKFIGEDGSLRLRNGQVYEVDVLTKVDYIWVCIPDFDLGEVTATWHCPYVSPQSFAANWRKP